MLPVSWRVAGQLVQQCRTSSAASVSGTRVTAGVADACMTAVSVRVSEFTAKI